MVVEGCEAWNSVRLTHQLAVVAIGRTYKQQSCMNGCFLYFDKGLPFHDATHLFLSYRQIRSYACVFVEFRQHIIDGSCPSISDPGYIPSDEAFFFLALCI